VSATAPTMRFQFTLATLLRGVTVVALLLALVRICYWNWLQEFEGQNETFERASRCALVGKFLPRQAKQINYWARAEGLIMANFAISEDDFLRWAAQEGSSVEQIEPLAAGTTVPNIYQRTPTLRRPKRGAKIKSGYLFREDDGDTIQVVAFDRDQERGYFTLVR